MPKGYARRHRGAHDMGDQDGSKLIGTWRLTAVYVIVEGTGERAEIFGTEPRGCIIVEPGGRIMAMLMSSSRTQASSEADTASLFKSMMAYTGQYSIDGEKFTTAGGVGTPFSASSYDPGCEAGASASQAAAPARP